MGAPHGRHPLELLRPRLLKDRLLPANQLAPLRYRQFARACGSVAAGQRPGTTKAVPFITIEHESGLTNIILWPAPLEKYRHEALGASLLTVYGVWQVEGKVRHLVAKHLVGCSDLLGGVHAESHDVH
jgi:error-prone DNA polymerase